MFVSGGYVQEEQRGTLRHELMHGSDWTPTLLSIAGLDVNEIDNQIHNHKHNNRKHNNNNKNKDKNTLLSSDFAEFDGFDLSNWLLYGNSNDNPRVSVGLSINEWDGGNDISVVFISEITGHLYKFMALAAPLGLVSWCTYCAGTRTTNWQPYRCENVAFEENFELLYDLTLDFNETTNLMSQQNFEKVHEPK